MPMVYLAFAATHQCFAFALFPTVDLSWVEADRSFPEGDRRERSFCLTEVDNLGETKAPYRTRKDRARKGE